MNLDIIEPLHTEKQMYEAAKNCDLFTRVKRRGDPEGCLVVANCCFRFTPGFVYMAKDMVISVEPRLTGFV